MKNSNKVDKRLNRMTSEKVLRKTTQEGILGKYQLNL